MHLLPRRASIAAIAAVAVALAAVVTVGSSIADATTQHARFETPGEPVFPRPGGGPRAIHALADGMGNGAYLLDAVRGEYRKLPYERLTVSPDGRTVAVEDIDGRIGVVDRQALLGAGDAAVRWTDLPPGSPSGWSPDGNALLVTTLDKDTRTFTAHRYDVATGRVRHTPINLDCDTCTAGWAADSTRYVVQLRGPDPEVPNGPMQYLNPDGTPGPLVGADGHIWNADSYSPSRRYVVVEPSRPFFPDESADWQLPRILELRTGKIISAIPTDWPALGWYDDGQIVRIAPADLGQPTTLEVVDIHTGQVTKRVSAPGLPAYQIQLGSSAMLHGEAAELGF
ncbi:MAG TPA: hypothetical protein VF462_01425 [Micromonosporaceae bacterium]